MTTETMTPFKVYLDGITDPANEDRPYVFDAYDDGTFWNGWRSPHFDFDNACALGVALLANGQMAGYDPERDLFFNMAQTDIPTLEELAEYEFYNDSVWEEWTRTSNGLYAVGAWAWTWEEAETEDCDECSGTRWPTERHETHCSLYGA